jgi:hypothetical protein
MLLVVSNIAKWSNSIKKLFEPILPCGWRVAFHPGAYARNGSDGRLTLQPPSGPGAQFALALKSRFEPRDIDQFLNQRYQKPDVNWLLVAPFLSPRSRELLKERQISYADFVGNVWLSGGSVLVDRSVAPEKGAVREAESRPRKSLRGPITARVIRLLCDKLGPLKVREIATIAHAHAGNVSRILDYLERERLIIRTARGGVSEVEWEPLLRRWAVDLAKERYSEAFLEPRGLGALVRRLAELDAAYAVTGPYAAGQLAMVAPPVAIDVYVRDIGSAFEALKLHRSERVGNVRLVYAFDDVVFERTMERHGVILACPSQVAADLLTMPKRSQEEYRALIEWMRENERLWRTP